MVKVTSGVNVVENDSFVGSSVSEVRSELGFVFGLTGSENAEVSTDGGATFRPASDDVVLEDGDQLRFTRAAGTKG